MSLAWATEQQENCPKVVNGREEKQYDAILEGTPHFSPDSRRVAYAAGVGDKQFVVVDEREEKQYDAILEGTPHFSPDSRRVAYAAGVGDKQFVVADGREEKQYDAILEGTPLFSPDSQRVAYAARLFKRILVFKVATRYVVVLDAVPVDAEDLEGCRHDLDAAPFITFDSPDRFRCVALMKGGAFYLLEEQVV